MHKRISALRKATAVDSAGILECLQAAFAPYRSHYTPEAFIDTVLTPGALNNRLAAMSVFVAVSGSGEIVGTIGCQVLGASEGHIRGMAVLPAWQGSGAAAQLLQLVETEMSSRGCTHITLDTTEPLRQAMRFYEKNGFRKSGKITDFFGMSLFGYVKTLA
jgi:ribosomal protein S18 acetylase RimI-like enzyme